MNTFTKIFRGIIPYRGPKAALRFINIIKELDELQEFKFRESGSKTIIILANKEIAKLSIRHKTQQVVLEVATDSSGQQIGVLTNILTNAKIDWTLGMLPFIPSHANLFDLFNVVKESRNEPDSLINNTQSIKGNDTKH